MDPSSPVHRAPRRPASEGASDPTALGDIHGRVRLGIVSARAVNGSLSFTELKDLLDTSDGNLSVHARRLEEAGYLTCTKSFAGRVPHTEYQLTEAGRGALEKDLDYVKALIDRSASRDRRARDSSLSFLRLYFMKKSTLARHRAPREGDAMPTSHAALPTPAEPEPRGRLHAAIIMDDFDEADLAAVREVEARERRFGGRPRQRRTEG